MPSQWVQPIPHATTSWPTSQRPKHAMKPRHTSRISGDNASRSSPAPPASLSVGACIANSSSTANDVMMSGLRRTKRPSKRRLARVRSARPGPGCSQQATDEIGGNGCMLIEVARGYLRREGTAEASREYRGGEDRGRDFVRMTVYSLSCSLSGDRLDPDRVIRVVLARLVRTSSPHMCPRCAMNSQCTMYRKMYGRTCMDVLTIYLWT